jgi:FKBP-type peptidyl-prolyl cis-trans isomerase (trigger factor)
LGKIIQQEKMELADEDLEKGFEEMAATYNQPVDVIKGFTETAVTSWSFLSTPYLKNRRLSL